jgi:hypothetical protein
MKLFRAFSERHLRQCEIAQSNLLVKSFRREAIFDTQHSSMLRGVLSDLQMRGSLDLALAITRWVCSTLACNVISRSPEVL